MAEFAGFALAKDYGLVSARKIVKRTCRDTVGQGRLPGAVLEDMVAPDPRVDWEYAFDPAARVGEARTIDDQFLGVMNVDH